MIIRYLGPWGNVRVFGFGLLRKRRSGARNFWVFSDFAL